MMYLPLIAAMPTAACDGATGQLSAATLGAAGPVGSAVAKLTFVGKPTELTAGETWTPPLVVAVTTSGPGALTPDPNGVGPSVRLTLAPGDGTLEGTVSQPWTGGEVSFADLSITQSGAKTLTATLVGGGVAHAAAASVTALPLQVVAGPVSQLLPVAGPTQAMVGTPLFPAPAWALLDAFGNPATLAAGAQATLNIAGGGSPSLRGRLGVAADGGQVAFPGVDLDSPGTYRLQATVPGVGPVAAAAALVVAPSSVVTAAAAAGSAAMVAVDPALQVDGGAVHLPRQTQQQTAFSAAGNASRGLAFDPMRNGLSLANSGGCDATQTQCVGLDPSWAPQPADLVGHWTFEGTGALANGDTISGTVGPNLVAVSADSLGLTFVPGRVGTALLLDGVDDFVQLPSGFPGSSEMTLAAWVRVDELRNFSYIFDIGHDTDNYIGLTMLGSGYRQLNKLGGAAEQFSDSAIGVASGVWQHLVVTVDGSVARLYEGGNMVGAVSSTTTPAALTTDNSALGRSVFSNDPKFKGALDEVAVWRVALSANEVSALFRRQDKPRGGTWTSTPMPFATTDLGWQSLAWQSKLPASKALPVAAEAQSDYPDLAPPGPAAGLSFMWHLDEPALGGLAGGDDFADSTSAGNHAYALDFQPSPGTVANLSRPGATGPFGGAVMLGLSNPNPAILTRQVVPGPSTFSLQAWFSSGSIDGCRVVGFSDSVDGSASNADSRLDRHLYLTPSGTLVFGVVSGGVQKTVVSPAAVADKAWHHAVGTLGPAGLALWIDGIRVAHDPSVQGADPYDGAWRMGWANIAASAWAQAPLREGFVGLLSEVAVWGRALGEAEVLQLYRRGSERVGLQLRACADATCSTNPPWQGPDGTPQTMFSEQLNRDAAGPSPYAPWLPLLALNTLPPPAFAPYMQLRVEMGASDAGALCQLGGLPASCQPALLSAQIAAAQIASPGASVTFRLDAAPRVLTAFSEHLGAGGCPGGVGYALSLDGTNFFTYAAGQWAVLGAGGSAAGSAASLDVAALLAFGRQVGVPAGHLFVRAFPRPQAGAGCALKAVGVTGQG